MYFLMIYPHFQMHVTEKCFWRHRDGKQYMTSSLIKLHVIMVKKLWGCHTLFRLHKSRWLNAFCQSMIWRNRIWFFGKSCHNLDFNTCKQIQDSLCQYRVCIGWGFSIWCSDLFQASMLHFWRYWIDCIISGSFIWSWKLRILFILAYFVCT